MNPGRDFETSMVGPIGILVALVKRKIGQGYSKLGKFLGDISRVLYLLSVLAYKLIYEQSSVE